MGERHSKAMTTALSTPLHARLPRGGRWLLGLVRFLLSDVVADLRQDCLLKIDGRLTGALEPIVSSGARDAGERIHKIGGGISSKVVCEGHGQTVSPKNKSAMRKIKLAKSPHCGQIESVNAPYLIQFELDGQWITCATSKTFDAAKAKAKAERKAMNGARETSVIREGDPECLRRKTCEQFELV